MERQEEYELRNNIKIKIIDNINITLNNYYKKYEYNIGYLLFYPMINIEESFIIKPEEYMKTIFKNGMAPNSDMMEFIIGSFYKSLVPEKLAIAWFVKEMIKRKKKFKQKYHFNKEEYEKFKELVPLIINLYEDLSKAEEIGLMRTIAKIKLEEKECYFDMKSPKLTDTYNKDDIYYYGEDDPKKSKRA